MSKLSLGVAMFVAGCAGASQTRLPPTEARTPAPVPIPQAPLVASTVPTQNSAPQSVAPPRSDGGTDVCHGSIDEALQHQLAGRAGQTRFCYERLLARDPRREGRLMITVRLSGTGTIDDAAITLDELGDPETSECVLASFKEPLNGAIAGGDCAIVNVPLRLMIKKPAQPNAPATPATHE